MAKQSSARPHLGHHFRFGFYHIPAEERMRALREAGYDEVMFHWSKQTAPSDEAPEKLFESAVRHQLIVRTVHFPQQDAHLLWTEGQNGESYTEQMLRTVTEIGARRIANLVIHTTRRLITPPPCAVGLARIRRVLNEAEKQGVHLAFENTRFLQYNAYLYDRLDSPNLAFCFDSGHAHCFTPGQDPLSRFGPRMVTMHLHDNFGPEQGDLHLPIGQGNIDFDALFARLKLFHPLCYNLESAQPEDGPYAKMGMEAYLAACYRTLHGHVFSNGTSL